MRCYYHGRRGATLAKKFCAYPWSIVEWNLSIRWMRGPGPGKRRGYICVRILESLMATLIVGYLLSSTCGTLVQGPRSSCSRRLPSQKPGIPTAAHFALPPSPPSFSRMRRKWDARWTTPAFYARRGCGHFPALPLRHLLASCSLLPWREGTRGWFGEGEKEMKKEGRGEREREKKKNRWKFRGEGKEAEEKRRAKGARGGFSPPIGSLATGSPTFAANRLSPRWLTSIVLERV